MPNTRIIHDNVADLATIVAASTAAGSTADNVKTEIKTEVYTSVGTSAMLTLTWSDDVTMAGLGIPACNLTADSTIRLIGYDSLDTVKFDTGTKYAAPGAFLGDWNWELPLNVNAFAYGGLTKVAQWLDDHYAIRKLEIYIDDPDNASGFIQLARLVVGAFWELECNPDWGSENGPYDNSRSMRLQDSSLITDVGVTYDVISLPLSTMNPQDRERAMWLIRNVGVSKSFFVCVFPDGADSITISQDWMIYGKRENSSLQYKAFRLHSTSLKINGW